MIKVSSSVSETQYSGFDAIGRLTESKQITPLDGETISTAPVRTSAYQYNLSGALIQQTYPSGRVVETDLDASGDIANVSSKKNSSAIFGTFANNISYSAAGAMTSMRLGNGKWENTKYNTRLQPIEMGLGASSTDAGAWKVAYEYGELQTNGTVDATKNSGNIGKQTLTVPGTSFVTAYKYDPLNRLTEAQEKTGSNQNWIQTFGYDLYGNRTSFSQTIGSTTTSTTPTVNASTNRFNTGQGFAYDANGNVTQDVDAVSSHTRSFTFNGDNKQTQVKDVTNSNHVVGTYYYDGEGKRVKKVTDTETTVFVYALGRIVAEYSTQISSTPSVAYTTADHLGSPRVITNEQAQVESRRDFMPFGEELYTGVGGRSSSINYGSSADDVRQKFTGYQKDSETNLDFAEARMYENGFGRFTAVDPLLASGQSSDPQTFNRYIYVRNSPLKYVDSSGEILVLANARARQTFAKVMLHGLSVNERKNFVVGRNGTVSLRNPNAINQEKASKNYQDLVGAINDKEVTLKVYTLGKGESVNTKSGNYTYQGAYESNGLISAGVDGVRDVIIPQGGGIPILVKGANGEVAKEKQSAPEDVIFWHEAIGHGQKGDANTIKSENEYRTSRSPGLPERTGRDHEEFSEGYIDSNPDPVVETSTTVNHLQVQPRPMIQLPKKPFE